jgi:outer membrane lipase/esterase
VQAIWVQRLAESYRFTFKECNPGQLSEDRLNAFMLARYGATVRTLTQQLDDFQANIVHDGIGSSDLVTVLAGLHDIIEIYKDNITYVTEPEKLAEAETRGKQVAALANRLANLGARVLVSQVLDVGLTPYALSEGASEAALMTRLSNAFNKGIRLELINDGTKIGLLALDDSLRTLVRYGGYNNSDLACDDDHIEPVSVVDDDGDGYIDGGGVIASCTTATARDETAAARNLWADSLHANAQQLHKTLGNLAISRANANPF